LLLSEHSDNRNVLELGNQGCMEEEKGVGAKWSWSKGKMEEMDEGRCEYDGVVVKIARRVRSPNRRHVKSKPVCPT